MSSHSEPPLENYLITASAIFAISFICGIIPYICKGLRKVGKLYVFINMLITGLNLGNICYDMIPEMSGHHKVNRKPCSLIGLCIIFLISIESFFVDDHHHHHHKEKKKNLSETPIASVKIEDSEHFHDHLEEDNFGLSHLAPISKTTDFLNVLIFLSAISLHSILEGLDTCCSNVFSSHTIGLFLHKAAESLSIGLALFSSKLKISTNFKLVLLFSTLTPISIFVGRFIKSSIKGIAPYFKALALGSLLYVVMLEGIGHNIHGKNKRMIIFALLLGYCLSVAFIQMSHSH
ncbi:ZIP family transporter [Nucleospora cyclopteri]